jgi:hypothetical protein
MLKEIRVIKNKILNGEQVENEAPGGEGMAVFKFP